MNTRTKILAAALAVAALLSLSSCDQILELFNKDLKGSTSVEVTVTLSVPLPTGDVKFAAIPAWDSFSPPKPDETRVLPLYADNDQITLNVIVPAEIGISGSSLYVIAWIDENGNGIWEFPEPYDDDYLTTAVVGPVNLVVMNMAF